MLRYTNQTERAIHTMYELVQYQFLRSRVKSMDCIRDVLPVPWAASLRYCARDYDHHR